MRVDQSTNTFWRFVSAGADVDVVRASLLTVGITWFSHMRSDQASGSAGTTLVAGGLSILSDVVHFDLYMPIIKDAMSSSASAGTDALVGASKFVVVQSATGLYQLSSYGTQGLQIAAGAVLTTGTDAVKWAVRKTAETSMHLVGYAAALGIGGLLLMSESKRRRLI